MPRQWNYEDTDEYRLPEGFKRVGYVAETQQYVFQSGGTLYEGTPGARYSPMTPVRSSAIPPIIPSRTSQRRTTEPMPRLSIDEKRKQSPILNVEPTVRNVTPQPDPVQEQTANRHRSLTLDPKPQKSPTSIRQLWRSVTKSVMHTRHSSFSVSPTTPQIQQPRFTSEPFIPDSPTTRPLPASPVSPVDNKGNGDAEEEFALSPAEMRALAGILELLFPEDNAGKSQDSPTELVASSEPPKGPVGVAESSKARSEVAPAEELTPPEEQPPVTATTQLLPETSPTPAPLTPQIPHDDVAVAALNSPVALEAEAV